MHIGLLFLLLADFCFILYHFVCITQSPQTKIKRHWISQHRNFQKQNLCDLEKRVSAMLSLLYLHYQGVILES